MITLPKKFKQFKKCLTGRTYWPILGTLEIELEVNGDELKTEVIPIGIHRAQSFRPVHRGKA
jgi:hypothetical protein